MSKALRETKVSAGTRAASHSSVREYSLWNISIGSTGRGVPSETRGQKSLEACRYAHANTCTCTQTEH